jgi:glycosyltransferase involved in cell wall biosynthesis
MEQPDCSVILGVRNCAHRLSTLLAHLEQQSWPAARYEIVVVDDGSTDDTADTLDRYARGAPVPTRCLRQPPGGLVRAWNRALRAATGRHVLFLDADLLASPSLIERHLAVQAEHQDKVCSVGAIGIHPQMEKNLITRAHLSLEQRPRTDQASLHFLDCRAQNLCIPRETLLAVDGFDESFPFPWFADAELVCRLQAAGLPAIAAGNAHAYEWLPARFDEECRRHYGKGYSLHHLHQRTGAAEIFRRFRVQRSALRRTADAFIMPYYIRACQRAAEDLRLLMPVYRRVLRYELSRGYEDARRGRPPRAPLI